MTSDVHERYKLCGVLWNKGADKHERRIERTERTPETVFDPIVRLISDNRGGIDGDHQSSGDFESAERNRTFSDRCTR